MPIPLFTMSLSKVPIAILKGGDRRLRFFKVKKFADKYWATKDGQVFELDDRYEYRWKKTSVYIFNFSNSKPLLLSGMEEIDETLKEEGESELFNIEDFTMALQEMKQTDPRIDVERIPMPKDLTVNMDARTRRFLQDYFADDERSKTEQMIKVHRQKTPIVQYSGELVPFGKNSGDYAIVQVAHKKLDIVPMFVHDDKAYCKYGCFDYSLDSVYYVQKQAIAFFVLNAEEDGIVTPMPKPAEKLMRALARKGQWKLLESYNKPHKTKIKKKAPGKTVFLLPVDMAEAKVDEIDLTDKKPQRFRWGFQYRRKKRVKESIPAAEPEAVTKQEVIEPEKMTDDELIKFINEHPELMKENEESDEVLVEDEQMPKDWEEADEPEFEATPEPEPERKPMIQEPSISLDDATEPPMRF